MGLVKVGDKLIPDRRTNGARLKLDVADWVKIFITIFTSFAIIIFGAGKLLAIVDEHSKTIAENCEQIHSISQKITKTESDVVNIKENLIYIRGKIDTLVLDLKND